MRVRRRKVLWFVYQFGLLDYVATNRKNAEEMAETPDTGDKRPYQIERWEFVNGKYQFKKVVQKGTHAKS